ncbi:MAG: SDR family NAD(P)-dependent oxidoreductase [Pseudomonadota bacterium]|nr:SDR family NAD(P)-dependent oxidoreductase [Pseudomonadota bacterium]
MSVAIITGASSGIGASLARELGRRKWKVGVIARRADLLDSIVAEVRAAGGEAAAATADVTDRAALDAAVAALEAALGPCDLMVANAGSGQPAPMHKVPIDTILSTMRLNFDGAVHSAGAVLPGMLERRRGHVAVVSSVAANRGLPGHGAYSASKAAISTLWEAMRVDLAPHGVRCTTIHPGFVATPLTQKNKFKMPFLLTADQAAGIVADGLERGAKEITFPWQMRWVATLMRWLPIWAWDRMAPKR